MVRPDGTFEIAGVVPGAYHVMAMRTEGMSATLGRTPVTVGQQNVDNVVVTLANPFTVSGTIRIDATKEELAQVQSQGGRTSMEGVRVQLQPVEGMMFNPGNSTTKADGTFTVENVGPDKYRLTTFGGPQGTWMKSVRAG